MNHQQNNNDFLGYLGIAVVILSIGLALKWIIPAIGTAIGFAGSLIAGSTVLSIGWAKAGIVFLAAGGVSMSINFFVNQGKKIDKKPFEWLLPILAILSGFAIDIVKEIFDGNGTAKILFGTITAVLFYIGGKLWIKKGILFKIISILCFLIAPCFVIVTFVSNNIGNGLMNSLTQIPIQNWIYLGILAFLIVFATIIAKVFSKKKQ